MQVGGPDLLWAAAQVSTSLRQSMEGRCLRPIWLCHLLAAIDVTAPVAAALPQVCQLLWLMLLSALGC